METKTETTNPTDAEIVDESIELARHPGAPITITDLAALEARGQQIIQFRVAILRTLRSESIRMTNPEDWLLFKAPGDIVTGYLQDKGCARIMPLWGIDVTITSKGTDGSPFTKEIDGEEFSMSITGFGTSSVTQARTEQHTGTRYSTEDFCKDIQLKLKKVAYVKLAARANLDGHIVREIAGLEGVPLGELEEAWKGTGKTKERCALGKGFGSKNSRMGQAESGVADIDPADVPICEFCEKSQDKRKHGTKLKFREKGNPPFWGCPNYADTGHPTVIINHEALIKRIAEMKPKPTPAPAGREPGEDG